MITEAAAGNDAVLGLTYVCAFAPETGESAFDMAGKFPGSTLGAALVGFPLSTGDTELAISRQVFHQQFAADVPAAEAALMAATRPGAGKAVHPAGGAPPKRARSQDREVVAAILALLAWRSGRCRW